MDCFAPFRHWWIARSKRTLGQQGETAAARYLQRHGCKVVARGEREMLGELDLVVVDGKTVVFVEVKTRRDHQAGHPAEAIDTAKQRRLTNMALRFLKRHGLLEHPARFDVIAVTWPERLRHPHIEHVIDAFPAFGEGQMFN